MVRRLSRREREDAKRWLKQAGLFLGQEFAALTKHGVVPEDPRRLIAMGLSNTVLAWLVWNRSGGRSIIGWERLRKECQALTQFPGILLPNLPPSDDSIPPGG
jgi:hypothetical protein